MEKEIDIEAVAMELVGNSGESRSLSFEALYLSKQGDMAGAQEKIKEAKEKMLKAHSMQTELICAEADGKDLKLGLLMVHAQDHLMTAILARELVEEMIELYARLEK